MAAELEMAAWDVRRRKMWSTFVEPPWEYAVRGQEVTLSIMGKVVRFSLLTGPEGP